MPYRPRAGVSPPTVARAEAALATADATIPAFSAAQVMKETAKAAAEKAAEAQAAEARAAEARADHYAREAKAKALEDQASLWLKQADSNEFNAELRAYYRDKSFEARQEAARLRGEDALESGSVDPDSRSVSFRM